jgi:hypothetical protein
MIALLAFSGCTTTNKGSVKGAGMQGESKSDMEIVSNASDKSAKH